jgi:hypothetical protein
LDEFCREPHGDGGRWWRRKYLLFTCNQEFERFFFVREEREEEGGGGMGEGEFGFRGCTRLKFPSKIQEAQIWGGAR